MNKQRLIDYISKKFNGASVAQVVIDDEFGNVTATVDGKTFTDCGFIEEFEKEAQTQNSL
ncbi:hypothetical protein EN12_24325 [Vibrio cholerae]|uniref:Uncharacterized protein n=1 Tax=Vibrio fluvialis PG41 TaxID=1336752 RepID=S7I0R1_VIBFL|nr:hypothetical protein [Vibrio fluvialis]AKO78221.1 hypothetical protein EN12_24325 [Vibrio cholerae]EPP21502.1 hypothetical protein L910_1181 [Vibrio fluvialis PG41]